MTDNYGPPEHETHDEFNEPEVGLSEESARKGVAGNLAEAWRTRPLFKLLVLVVAVFAVGVAAVNFLGNGSNPEVARVGRPPDLKEPPGGASSPYMRQETELANKERSEQAIASGGSAMPTPTRQNTDVGAFGGEGNKNDPLKELRAETERLQKQVQQQQVQQQQQMQRQRPPQSFDDSLAMAMQDQMKELLRSWTPKGIQMVSVSKADAAASDGKAAAAGAASSPAAAQQPAQSVKTVVSAGTVSYAQLLTEANSDVPGPILAQIVSGPLAGARAIGAFKVADGYEKYLVMTFSLADKKGKDYKINAIALDPDTTLGGMATEVDERYFARVVLPAAAGFLQGLGEAMGQGDSSVVSNGATTLSTTAGNGFKQGMYNGLGLGAQTMSQFFQNQANLTQPLVRVAAGTPMGLFFVEPVMADGSSQPPGNAANARVNPTPGYGNIGNNSGYGGAYPGAAASSYGMGGPNPASSAPYPNYATPGYGYGLNANMGSYGGGMGGMGGYGGGMGGYGASPYRPPMYGQ